MPTNQIQIQLTAEEWIDLQVITTIAAESIDWRPDSEITKQKCHDLLRTLRTRAMMPITVEPMERCTWCGSLITNDQLVRRAGEPLHQHCQDDINMLDLAR